MRKFGENAVILPNEYMFGGPVEADSSEWENISEEKLEALKNDMRASVAEQEKEQRHVLNITQINLRDAEYYVVVAFDRGFTTPAIEELGDVRGVDDEEFAARVEKMYARGRQNDIGTLFVEIAYKHKFTPAIQYAPANPKPSFTLLRLSPKGAYPELKGYRALNKKGFLLPREYLAYRAREVDENEWAAMHTPEGLEAAKAGLKDAITAMQKNKLQVLANRPKTEADHEIVVYGDDGFLTSGVAELGDLEGADLGDFLIRTRAMYRAARAKGEIGVAANILPKGKKLAFGLEEQPDKKYELQFLLVDELEPHIHGYG